MHWHFRVPLQKGYVSNHPPHDTSHVQLGQHFSMAVAGHSGALMTTVGVMERVFFVAHTSDMVVYRRLVSSPHTHVRPSP